MGWTDGVADLGEVSPDTLRRLDALMPTTMSAGSVLFRPGDSVRGYVLVLEGRIGVHLVGTTGRDILLYEVAPGSSCIQSTLGLLGEQDYSAEAVVETKSRIVLVPRVLFLSLLDADSGFRRLVFSAFARHLQSTMHLLERVAFQSVDARLAAFLLDRTQAADSDLQATQQDIASAIGSAREVISRRLDAMRRNGWITHERGQVTILDRDALRLAADRAG